MSRLTIIAFALVLAASRGALAKADAGVGPKTAPSPQPVRPSVAASVAEGGAPAPPPPVAEPGPKHKKYATCQEHLAAGKERPPMTEVFPDKGLSGYALPLEVEIEHGQGETVMPGGLTIRLETDEAKALEKAGFFLPDPKGTAQAERKSEKEGDRAKTKIVLPFVALPEKPGRHELELPPIPISLARASGEVLTLCTRPHPIVIEDPIANIPDAKPKRNPAARRQLEEWTAAKHAAVGALIALAVAALTLALIAYLRRRPKAVKPPPPPRPPWEVAMEELFDIRHAGLIERQRFQAHFDRVSHTVRRYLGDRYGFDGLESTTQEILQSLGNVSPPIQMMPQIRAFLDKADLVKFAKVTPTEAECDGALTRGEAIVVQTIPAEFEKATPDASHGGGTE